MNEENKKFEDMNKLFWNEVAPVHMKSYNIERLRQKKSLLSSIELDDLGDMKNKKLLHLQCHIGTDSISLANQGAKVTGVDFSKESIEAAKILAKEFNADINFIESNIYDIDKKLDETFDIVFTSKGVLCWLNDINEWGRLIAKYLKKGGFFYIMEIHPFKFMLDDTLSDEVKIKYSYFHKDTPVCYDDEYPDYSDKNYIPKNHTYEWNWSLGDILNALICAGLRIEYVREYDKLFYNGLPGMVRDEDGWWFLPKYKGLIPMTYTIKAVKENSNYK